MIKATIHALFVLTMSLGHLSIGHGMAPKPLPVLAAITEETVKSQPVVANGQTEFTLTAEERTELTTHIDDTFAELVDGFECAAGTHHPRVMTIISATRGLEGPTIDNICLQAEISKWVANTSIVGLCVDSEHGTYGRIHDVDDFSIFPPCVSTALSEEQAAAAASQTPSTPEEQAEHDKELNETGIESIGHTSASANSASSVRKLYDLFMSAAHVATAKRIHGASYNPKLHGDRAFPYALGYVAPTESVVAKYLVTAKEEHVRSGTMAADYTPFTGAAARCLSEFPARDQGSCGSCYAFASTTALSLKYCLEVYRRGYNHDDTPIPVLTAQNMVSCDRGYDSLNGCDGGNGEDSSLYLRDYGVTTVACLPYMEGGGDPTQHFEAPPSSTDQCYTTCTDAYREQYPDEPMRFVSGKPSATPKLFQHPENIKQAILDHGPLMIGHYVYDSSLIGKEENEYVFTLEDIAGEYRGNHAVVVYGWGTTSKGLQYWKLINSWGSWGIPGSPGEFRIELGRNVAYIEALGAWTIELDPADVMTGPPSPLPPASPPAPPDPPMPPSRPPMAPKDEGICYSLVPQYGCNSVTVGYVDYYGNRLTIRETCPVMCADEPFLPPPSPQPSRPPPSPKPPPSAPACSTQCDDLVHSWGSYSVCFEQYVDTCSGCDFCINYQPECYSWCSTSYCTSYSEYCGGCDFCKEEPPNYWVGKTLGIKRPRSGTDKLLQINGKNGCEGVSSKDFDSDDIPGWMEWERFEVKDAGDGKIALWNRYHKRFLRMSDTCLDTAYHETGELPSGWTWEVFEQSWNGQEDALWSPKWQRFIRFNENTQSWDRSGTHSDSTVPSYWAWERLKLLDVVT